MFKFSCFFFSFSTLFSWFLFFPVFAQAQEPFKPTETLYLWPTNASKYASASLGETRSAHFHAAMDIKTWGRVGYKVFATRDGILHRIGRGPYGYGNVIYLKHDDGSFSVYAHLDRFIPELDHLVDSLRWEKKAFVFDEMMEDFGIYYKQGDLIGYTGQSGIGPPHLHFELRTPTESPFNPLITSLKIKDKVAPTFSALAIEPLDKFAKVEDQKKIYVKKPRRIGRNFDFGTIQVEGQVGLAVDVFDQANDVSNVYAVYELELRLKNDVLFHSRIDSFSYSQTRQMFLDRVYGLLKSQNKGFQRLYRHDGNTLPFYLVAKSEAKLSLPEGKYDIEIIARDFYKNETKAFVTLHFLEKEKEAESFVSLTPATGNWEQQLFPEDLKKWDWQNNWVKPVSIEKILDVELESFDFFTPNKKIQLQTQAEQVIDLAHLPSVLLKQNSNQTLLYRVEPGKSKTVITPDQWLTVRFFPESVYDTLSLSIGHYWSETDSAAMIYVFPEQEPLQSGFEISLMLPESYSNPEKTALYQYNFRAGRLDFMRSKTEGNRISARLRDFGFYKVLTDTLSPELSNPKLYRKSGGKWVVTLDGKDDLSGIDYNRSRFWVNGKEGILEYDPELRKIMYYHPDFIPQKENKAELEVFDFEGNKTKATFYIRK